MGPERVLESLSRALAARRSGRGRVLVLDEDPLTRSYVVQCLKRLGVTPVPVEDPLDFWAILEREEPGLVLLGVELPGMSGLDICRALRASLRWRTLAIVLLSSSTGLDMRIDAYNAGADDFVPKPVLPEELVARLIPRLDRAKCPKEDPSSIPVARCAG